MVALPCSATFVAAPGAPSRGRDLDVAPLAAARLAAPQREVAGDSLGNEGREFDCHITNYMACLSRCGSIGVVTDIVLQSLSRRLAALRSLYDEALDTMSLEHVNHVEREGLLPIAFSLFHITNMVDAAHMLITGEAPIWNDEWNERVAPTIPDHGKHRTVGEMTAQRIGNYDEFKQYFNAVFDRTQAWVSTLQPADLHRVVIGRPFPPQVASTFSARAASEEGITVLDAVECWVYQHALRHMGEIELARGFVGLGGMTS